MIAPQIEEMSKSHDNVVFLKVDVDEAEDAAQEFNVSAMPTFMIYKDGKNVDSLVGASKEKLESLVQKFA